MDFIGDETFSATWADLITPAKTLRRLILRGDLSGLSEFDLQAGYALTGSAAVKREFESRRAAYAPAYAREMTLALGTECRAALRAAGYPIR